MSLTKRTILMTTLTSLAALSLSLLSANVQADNAPVFGQLQNELNVFAKQIQQLSNAQVQSENSYRYQNDPQISDIENNNVAVNSATQDAAQNTDQLSTNSLQAALTPISDANLQPSGTAMATYSTTQADNAANAIAALKDNNKNYSWGITASDTLFANYPYSSDKPNENYQINGQSVDPLFKNQPSSLHDNYLDFTNFIQPSSLNYNYSNGGSASADNYIQFVTKDYQPLYSQIIDLNLLNQKISSANNSDSTGDTAAAITRYLATSDTFQKAQTTIRQAIAQKSAGMYVLHKIQSERSAITSKEQIRELETMADEMGIEVTQSNGVYVYPSKAQIDYYQSHHDLNSESWYQNLQTLSAPNVQRETLITLKQIQQSLAQQHQDSETIQALLAITNIQNAGNVTTALSTDKQTLDKWLENMDFNNLSSPDSSTTSGSDELPKPS